MGGQSCFLELNAELEAQNALWTPFLVWLRTEVPGSPQMPDMSLSLPSTDAELTKSSMHEPEVQSRSPSRWYEQRSVISHSDMYSDLPAHPPPVLHSASIARLRIVQSMPEAPVTMKEAPHDPNGA